MERTRHIKGERNGKVTISGLSRQTFIFLSFLFFSIIFCATFGVWTTLFVANAKQKSRKLILQKNKDVWLAKFSREFIRTQSRIMDALTQFDELLLKSQLYVQTGSVPRISWDLLEKTGNSPKNVSNSCLSEEEDVENRMPHTSFFKYWQRLSINRSIKSPSLSSNLHIRQVRSQRA